MKVLSWACKILAVLASVGTLVLMFFAVTDITAGGTTYSLSAFQLAFGSTVNDVDFWKSSYYLFAAATAIIAAVCSAVSVKKQKATIGALVFSAITTVMMIIFAASTPASYIDVRPLVSAKAGYTMFFWVLLATAAASVLLTVADIFTADAVEVAESNGAKKTLLKRFVSWIKEYKSEIKKISWPTVKTVVKNSVLVLLCCLVVGVIIWLADYGLSNLVKVIFK